MSLLDQFRGSLDRFRHSQASHYDREAAPAKGRDGDGALDFGEFGGAGSRGEDAHVVEFGEEELFVF